MLSYQVDSYRPNNPAEWRVLLSTTPSIFQGDRDKGLLQQLPLVFLGFSGFFSLGPLFSWLLNSKAFALSTRLGWPAAHLP